MSYLSKLRQKWKYETDVPRCQNCKHVRRPGRCLVNSLPRTSPMMCKLGDFVTRPCAVCDRWESPAGEKLAATDTRT